MQRKASWLMVRSWRLCYMSFASHSSWRDSLSNQLSTWTEDDPEEKFSHEFCKSLALKVHRASDYPHKCHEYEDAMILLRRHNSKDAYAGMSPGDRWVLSYGKFVCSILSPPNFLSWQNLLLGRMLCVLRTKAIWMQHRSRGGWLLGTRVVGSKKTTGSLWYDRSRCWRFDDMFCFDLEVIRV